MSDYLRYVYTRSVGLEQKQRKLLIKTCLQGKLQQYAEKVGGNVDIADMLRQLTVYFGENFVRQGQSSGDMRIDDNDVACPATTFPSIKKTKKNSNQNDRYTGGNFDQASLQRLIEILVKKPNSIGVDYDEALQNPEQALEDIFNTLLSLQNRFAKTGTPLLEMLKRIDKVLVASDNSIQEATQASFDLIIDSLDPAVFGQAVDRRQYRTKKAYLGELYEMYIEKHLQLKLYHEQGRFVKDCRAIYREKMKKYGL